MAIEGNILITGATGFVGAALVRQLIEDGVSPARIRCLVRRGSPGAWLLDGLPVQRFEGTLANSLALARAARDCELLFHAAAYFQVGTGLRERYERTNVEGTRRLLSIARESGVRRVVVVSSIAATAEGSIEDPATEATPYDLGRFRLPYVDTKRAQEEVALAESDDRLEVVVVNPGFVFGPGDVKPVTGLLLLQFALEALPLVPPGWLSSVDVRDVARGMVLAAERGRPGARYILVERRLSYLDLGRMAASIREVRPPLGALPRPLLVAGGLVADALTSLLGVDLPFSSNVALYSAATHCTSGDLAHRELGLDYRPLETSIRDAYAWFDEHGYTKRSRLRLLWDATRRRA